MNICTPGHYTVRGKSHEVSSDEYTHPTPTAEMKVPRNANVKIVPKLRKKFS